MGKSRPGIIAFGVLVVLRLNRWIKPGIFHVRKIRVLFGQWPSCYPLVNIPKTYGTSPFLMGKLIISMAMFNSYVSVYQRVSTTKWHIAFPSGFGDLCMDFAPVSLTAKWGLMSPMARLFLLVRLSIDNMIYAKRPNSMDHDTFVMVYP